MSEHETPAAIRSPRTDAAPAQPRRARSRNAIFAAGALGLFALGLAGGTAAWSASRAPDGGFDAALASTPIGQLAEAPAVGITGQVAEIYGNKFVVTDGTARALVETGRAGEGGKLVAAGETVTVQGRFDNGFLHASAIRHAADQRVDALDPPPPPPPLHGSDPTADRGSPAGTHGSRPPG